MKRLNITKEQFEKSRYFKNKYGTLEYVSESGKMFKTDKGKVLMFKEGFKDKIKGFGRTVGNFMGMFTKGTNVYVWHSGTGDWYDALDNNEPVWCGKIVERNASSGEYGIEVSKLKSKDAKHRKLKTGDSVDIYDVAGAYQSGTVSKIDGNMLYVARNVSSGNNAEEIDNNDKELFDTTESSKKFGKKFSESEGGVTCHATCVDWDAPKTKTFKTLAQCKRWMETTADEIASEWGSMVEGLAVWAEDDELIVISGNGKVVAKFKIVPDYEDFHDPNEYYQESDNKKFGKKFKESIVDDEQKWNDELWDCIIADVQSLGDDISSALIDADGNPTYDFEAAVKVARNAVSQEIADEVGEDITFTNELSQFVTPMEYASRIVDYVIEKQPTKSIARRLKKIGY